MENFKCSGDCLKCHPNQRQYCASQFTYNTMMRVDDLFREVTKMVGTVEELKAKIEAIQGNEASLFDPTKEDMSQKQISETKAQSGDGAENRSPVTI